MKYFLCNLGAHTLVLVVLVIALIITFNRNSKGKAKHVLTYFLPVIISMFILFDMVRFTAPRWLDLTSVLRENYQTTSGVLEKVGRFGNYVVIDGVMYYVNPTHQLPIEGSTVKFKYTDNSRYAIISNDNHVVVTPISQDDASNATDIQIEMTYQSEENNSN